MLQGTTSPTLPPAFGRNGEERDLMTRLEEYLTTLDPEQRQQCEEWLASRPPGIRELAHQYPPGAIITVRGCTFYVVGYNETDREPGLLASQIDPNIDYEGAVKSRVFICGHHDLNS